MNIKYFAIYLDIYIYLLIIKNDKWRKQNPAAGTRYGGNTQAKNVLRHDGYTQVENIFASCTNDNYMVVVVLAAITIPMTLG